MNQKGFTLIELLVVIGIIGMLSTVSLYSYNNARKHSRDAMRVAHISDFRLALELYYDSQTGYPPGSSILLGSTNYDCLNSASGFTTTGCGAPLMANVPSNPTPAGSDYIYSQTGGGTGYTITFTLENAVGDISAGFHTVTPSGIQ